MSAPGKPNGRELEPLPTDVVRELDRRAIEDYGIPGVVLMENAGRGAAELARELLGNSPGPVVILAGRGNNGGDGYVLARHLANAGIRTQTFLLAPVESVTGDAGINLDIIIRMGLAVMSVDVERDRKLLADALSEAALVVDALLGTGARGEVRGAFRQAIELINASGKPVLAIDIPSGLDADSGEVRGIAVKASATATFLCAKPGLTRNAGPEHAGRVVVVDIGISRNLPPMAKRDRS